MKLPTLSMIIVSMLCANDFPSGSSRDYYMGSQYNGGPSNSVAAPVQEEQCWYEQVPIQGSSQSDDSGTRVAGAIVGGILGGVIGHQFGSGHGNTAATLGGAALGTALGSRAGANPQPQYQLIRKCNSVR